MQDVVIVGCGGLGQEVLWLLETINEQFHRWNFLGFVDSCPEGDRVIGDDQWLSNIGREIAVVFGVGDPLIKERVFGRIRENVKLTFPSIIHPSVLMHPSSKIGDGSVIFAKSVLSVGSSLGSFVFLNFGCNIGHHSTIGNFCSVNTSTNISGHVDIGDGSLIGVGSTVLEKVKIGKNVTIGLGSVVTTDIPSNCVALGYPAKPMIPKGPLNERVQDKNVLRSG